ncbi:MAG: DUF4350 domain-containing protein [Myxococcota bacterium]
MAIGRRFLLFVLRVSVLTSLLGSTPSWAAPFDFSETGWEGSSEFLHLARETLGRERVLVVSVLDWEALRPDDGVILIHPVESVDAEEAASFMKAGGRLAVVDDFGAGDQLLEHFKISRSTFGVEAERFLRRNPALSIATPAVDGGAEGEAPGLHPTVADVDKVILNHATSLLHPDLTPVLEVSLRDGTSADVAVAGQIDGPKAKGRLFAMGDPSAFINLMLRYQGNRAFAEGMVRYLADGDATDEREGRLFLAVNDFGERGSFGGVTPFRKEIDRKLQVLKETYLKVQAEGFPWWLHVVIAGLAALLVVLWVGRTLVKPYRGRIPRFARPTPLVSQGGHAGRAAVLASPVSPPALALLEMRQALDDVLALHLDQPPGTSSRSLLDALIQRGALNRELEQDARAMIRQMRTAEDALRSHTSPRVTRADVVAASAVVDRILKSVGLAPMAARTDRGTVPSPQ